MLTEHADYIVGIDPDRHKITAAIVVTATGAVVATEQFTTTAADYRKLACWADRHLGEATRVWSIEGANMFGAGATATLQQRGETEGVGTVRRSLETYVLTCPVFYFGEEVKTIGTTTFDPGSDEYGIDVPVPHAFIKSVKGRLKLWTFEMKNEELFGDLGDYLVGTYDAEQIVGGRFWDRVSGGDMHKQKKGANRTLVERHPSYDYSMSYERAWQHS